MAFFNEGFWACIGAIIGGLTTYLVSKETIKMELDKMKISFLIEKLRTLESIKKNYQLDFTQTVDAESETKIINDFEFFSKVYHDLAHYFINSVYLKEVSNEYENIISETENKNNENNNNSIIIYFYRDFNIKMHKLINYELKQTTSEIKKMTTKK